MNFFKLDNFIAQNSEPKFRANQIKQAVLNGIINPDQISNIPKNLKEKLKNEFPLLSLKVNKVLISKNKDSFKASLFTQDNNLIETVLMESAKNGWTICLSSQIGCPLNCTFCATGASGFKRDLNYEEITDQVLFWRAYLKDYKIEGKITNIVYMGMGEPFLNWENVRKSLEIFNDPNLFNIGARAISVSTSGIPEGIKKLADQFNQVNLALSLHSAREKTRKLLMPIARRYNLDNLKESLESYLNKTKRKVFIEYILLKDINDTSEEQKALIDFLNFFTQKYLLHVNLIPYNQTSDKFKTSEENVINNFKFNLLRNKISATVRKSWGTDIQSACGQLK